MKRVCHPIIPAVLTLVLLAGPVAAQDRARQLDLPAGGTLGLAAGQFATADLPNLLVQPPARFAANLEYVLQLDGPITPERRAALAEAGIELGGYLPDYAYLVALDSVAPADLQSFGFLTWVGAYRNEWKLSSVIGQRVNGLPYTMPDRVEKFARGEVVVDITLFAGMGSNDALDAILAIGGVQWHRTDLLGDQLGVTVTIPLANVPQLAQIDAVQWVEEAPDVELRNSTTRWIAQSNASGSFPVYDAGIHGENEVVGILDGRVDSNHCSFSDTPPFGPTHRKILAYNAPLGANFHGTHVAGTVVGDNGVDDNTRGVAYLGKLVFGDVPAFTDSGVYDALLVHHIQGARMHTNSWGNDGTTQYDGLARGIDRFSYDYEDSLVLFAVTNTGNLRNPENAKNLLAVGASQDTPNQGSHCSGGAGPTADGRRKPEVYLPGCGTQSSSAGTSCGTTGLTGTSMACPAVAGSAMLVRQYYMDGYYPTGVAAPANGFTPSGALVKATVINSSEDMTGVAGYPSNAEGWGRVHLDNALHFSGEVRTIFVDDVRNASGLLTSEFVEYSIQVLSSGEKLEATLVWTDPPATAGSGSPSINNLDLEVIDPSAMLYRGNVFVSGESATGGAADAINNVEQVHLSGPALGAWTVRVSGAAVNQGPQGFGLVITGAVAPDLPALTISLPNGTPALVAPNTPTNFDVQIVPGLETVASADLMYRINGGAFVAAPLAPQGGDLYTATLPGVSCGDTLEYYISAVGSGGTTVTSPMDAPTSLLSSLVGEPTTLVVDAFEVASGWTVGAVDDDATRGIWNRMDPEMTAAQPEVDHTVAGTDCWITDGFAGGSLGAGDVDFGKTTLFSAVYNLNNALDATISYYRWYSNDAGSAPNEDVFTVDITSDGSNWVNAETVGPSGAGTSGLWLQHTFNVTDFVPLSGTVQVRFVASDFGAGSIIEAGVDDFNLDATICSLGLPCPTDFDGNGFTDLGDLAIVLGNFGRTGVTPAEGDADGDGDVDLSDLAAVLGAFGGICP